MVFLGKKENKFDLVLDHVVESCLANARGYDTSRLLNSVPPKDQAELLQKFTHLKGDDFFENRRELYESIFKKTFLRDGKIIPPVPKGQQKKRFLIAGTHYSGRPRFFDALLNRSSSVPAEIQKTFDRVNNKHAITIDLRKVRYDIPEYHQAIDEGYPYPGAVVGGEVSAICKTMINTAKMLGYNIIDYHNSHTLPKSDREIEKIKGFGRIKGEGYELYSAAVTGDSEMLIASIDNQERMGSYFGPEKIRLGAQDLAKDNSYAKLMRRSDDAFLVWDHGDEKDYSMVASAHNGELKLHDRQKWNAFKEQKTIGIDGHSIPSRF